MLALGIAAPACAETVADWQSLIDEAAARFALPAAWIARVMQAESRGQTSLGDRPIVSAKGAMGLMQLMPGTWAALRDAYALGPDPYAPRANILAGAAYLRAMYDRFGYPGCFAAYNAGPARYAASLAGVRLPAETRSYLVQVAGADAAPLPHRGATPSPAAPPTMFAIRAATIAPGSLDPVPSGLFAIRR